MVLIVKPIFPLLTHWKNRCESQDLKELDPLVANFWKTVPQKETVTGEKARQYLKICTRDLKKRNLPARYRTHLERVRDLCKSTLESNKDLNGNTTNEIGISLYERLDIAIAIFEKCEKLESKRLSDTDQEALTYLKGCCREFIRIVANATTMKKEDIEVIKEKRRVDPTYLPNHLPDTLSEPPYMEKNKPNFGLSDVDVRNYYTKLRRLDFKRRDENFKYLKQIESAIYCYETWANPAKEKNGYEQKYINWFLQRLEELTGRTLRTAADIEELKSQWKKDPVALLLEHIDATILSYERCTSRLATEIKEEERSKLLDKQEKLLKILSNIMKRELRKEDISELKRKRKENPQYPIVEEKFVSETLNEETMLEIFRLKFKEKRIQETLIAFRDDKLLRVNKRQFLKETLPKSLLDLRDRFKKGELESPNKIKVVHKSLLSLDRVYNVYSEAVKAYRRFKMKYPSPDPFDPKTNLSQYFSPYQKGDLQDGKEGVYDRDYLQFIQAQGIQFKEVIDPFNAIENPLLLMKYLNEGEREKFRILIENGRFIKLVEMPSGLKRVPASTKDNTSHSKTDGWVSFVMTNKGEIFAGSHVRNTSYLHSSFSNGSWVSFAGEMKIDNEGRLRRVSIYSGHYGPKTNHLQNFALHLASKGVDLSQCVFYDFDHEAIQKKSNEIEELRLSGNRTSQELQTLKEQLDKEKEQFKYKKCSVYKPQVGLVPLSIRSKKEKIAIGIFVALFMLSFTAMCASGAILPFLTVSIPIIIALVLASVATLVTALVLGKKLGIFSKLLQWFGTLKNPKIQRVKPKRAISVNDLHALRTQKGSEKKKSQRSNHSKTEKIHMQDVNQVSGNYPSERHKFVCKDYTIKDAEFGDKWQVADPKSAYPEWTQFVDNIKDCVKDGNYRRVNQELEKSLEELTATFFDIENRIKFKNPPFKVFIWREENIVKLFAEIVEELVSEPKTKQLFTQVEKEVFFPVIETVTLFISRYRNLELTTSIRESYYVARNKILEKHFPPSNNCDPTESMETDESHQNYGTKRY